MNALHRSFLAALILPVFAFGAGASASAAGTLHVPLFARNGSGESGTAVLTQHGPDIVVRVVLARAPAGPQPIHIHGGTCDAPASVRWPLVNLENGASTTLLRGVSLAALRGHGYIINVHESTTNMGRYVACGSI